MKRRSGLALAVCAALGSTGPLAEVVARGVSGFVLSHQLPIAGSPERVYEALIDVGGWWNPDHSYAGSAAGLYLEPRAGGCFCERLPDGGSVEHMRVVFVAPGRRLRLVGGLGPLQGMGASGVMEFVLEEQPDGRTLLGFTYAVSGFAADGLQGTAEPVDGVLAEQLGRLAARVASGR